MKKIMVLAFLAGAISAPLYAAKVKVKNNSTKDIQIQGYGLGCAGVTLGRGLMCGTKPEIIQPGESKTITYRTNQLGTKGGIRVLSIENGAQYNLGSPKGNFKEFSESELQFPADFGTPITPDLKAEKKRILNSGKLDKTRENKQFYYLAFAKDKNGVMVLADEGDLPLDGTLKIGIDKKFNLQKEVTQFNGMKNGKPTYVTVPNN